MDRQERWTSNFGKPRQQYLGNFIVPGPIDDVRRPVEKTSSKKVSPNPKTPYKDRKYIINEPPPQKYMSKTPSLSGQPCIRMEPSLSPPPRPTTEFNTELCLTATTSSMQLSPIAQDPLEMQSCNNPLQLTQEAPLVQIGRFEPSSSQSMNKEPSLADDKSVTKEPPQTATKPILKPSPTAPSKEKSSPFKIVPPQTQVNGCNTAPMQFTCKETSSQQLVKVPQSTASTQTKRESVPRLYLTNKEVCSSSSGLFITSEPASPAGPSIKESPSRLNIELASIRLSRVTPCKLVPKFMSKETLSSSGQFMKNSSYEQSKKEPSTKLPETLASLKKLAITFESQGITKEPSVSRQLITQEPASPFFKQEPSALTQYIRHEPQYMSKESSWASGQFIMKEPPQSITPHVKKALALAQYGRYSPSASALPPQYMMDPQRSQASYMRYEQHPQCRMHEPVSAQFPCLGSAPLPITKREPTQAEMLRNVHRVPGRLSTHAQFSSQSATQVTASDLYGLTRSKQVDLHQRLMYNSTEKFLYPHQTVSSNLKQSLGTLPKPSTSSDHFMGTKYFDAPWQPSQVNLPPSLGTSLSSFSHSPPNVLQLPVGILIGPPVSYVKPPQLEWQSTAGTTPTKDWSKGLTLDPPGADLPKQQKQEQSKDHIPVKFNKKVFQSFDSTKVYEPWELFETTETDEPVDYKDSRMYRFWTRDH